MGRSIPSSSRNAARGYQRSPRLRRFAVPFGLPLALVCLVGNLACTEGGASAQRNSEQTDVPVATHEVSSTTNCKEGRPKLQVFSQFPYFIQPLPFFPNDRSIDTDLIQDKLDFDLSEDVIRFFSELNDYTSASIEYRARNRGRYIDPDFHASKFSAFLDGYDRADEEFGLLGARVDRRRDEHGILRGFEFRGFESLDSMAKTALLYSAVNSSIAKNDPTYLERAIAKIDAGSGEVQNTLDSVRRGTFCTTCPQLDHTPASRISKSISDQKRLWFFVIMFVSSENGDGTPYAVYDRLLDEYMDIPSGKQTSPSYATSSTLDRSVLRSLANSGLCQPFYGHTIWDSQVYDDAPAAYRDNQLFDLSKQIFDHTIQP